MLDRGHHAGDAQTEDAPVNPFGAGQGASDTHFRPARTADLDGGQIAIGTHHPPASVNQLANGHRAGDTHSGTAVGNPHVEYVAAPLLFLADQLDDIERLRIATENRLRSLRDVKAYCGYAPDQKRRKGVKSNWNASAKMRAYLCAEKCVQNDGKPDKNGKPRALSPYRAVYDERRAHTALTHPDWTAGHSYNDALRIVAKAILKDLWREAGGTSVSPTPISDASLPLTDLVGAA